VRVWQQGYGGASCLKSSSSEGGTSVAYSFQVGLMVVLLVSALVLTGVVGYLGFRITEFRKEQQTSFSSAYTGQTDGTEMVNRPF
jgi:predicted Na+-dependent transporter